MKTFCYKIEFVSSQVNQYRIEFTFLHFCHLLIIYIYHILSLELIDILTTHDPPPIIVPTKCILAVVVVVFKGPHLGMQ